MAADHPVVRRPLAMALMAALHGSFGIMMRLGPFSWFMICWSFLFPQAVHWEILNRWYSKRSRAWVVVYDRHSPLAFWRASKKSMPRATAGSRRRPATESAHVTRPVSAIVEGPRAIARGSS